MSRIIEKKKKPAAPWYIAGAVWVVGALALPIYELWALGLVAVASVAALAAAFKLCPPVIVTKEVPWFTGREDADEMLNRIDADRKRLLELDERIPDDALSAAIRRMEAACSGILAQLEKDPDKASQVRRFTNHYLPDAVKILTLYAEMEETGVSGENAEEVRRQVEANAAVIATAFENQLDSLYSAAALDLDADLEVLKGMLKGQGLVE